MLVIGGGDKEEKAKEWWEVAGIPFTVAEASVAMAGCGKRTELQTALSRGGPSQAPLLRPVWQSQRPCTGWKRVESCFQGCESISN